MIETTGVKIGQNFWKSNRPSPWVAAVVGLELFYLEIVSAGNNEADLSQYKMWSPGRYSPHTL